MGKAFAHTGLGAYTRACGATTSATAKVMRDSAMGISTWEITRWARSRAKAYTLGSPETLTMENGSME